jgi:uncharacterized protein (TIGR02246 family)
VAAVGRFGSSNEGRSEHRAIVAGVDDDIRWLVDRTRIRELTARYNRCFDDGDISGFAATFTEDGIMEVEGGFRVQGRSELEKMCERTPYGVVHVTVDPTVEVDGDRAVQVSTILVVQRPKPDAGPSERTSSLSRTGRYRDELVRTPQGWRFAKRTVTLDGGL